MFLKKYFDLPWKNYGIIDKTMVLWKKNPNSNMKKKQ